MSTIDLQPRPNRERDVSRDDDVTGPPMSTTRGPGHAAPPPPPPAPDRRPRTPGRGRSSLVAAALVGAVAAAVVATPIALLVDDGVATATATTDAAASDAGAIDEASDQGTNTSVIDVSAVAEAVTPSVVRVNVTTPVGSGTGSGVVFDDAGNIVTNNHVVGEAGTGTVTVTLPDGRELDATVVGTDPTTDLAVVHVDDDSLVPVVIAQDPPAIGAAVVAIGSPFGLDGSVTSGIVSALNREVASSTIPLTGLVQTDAAINPGNSGGALVDARGELVGINTAIASSSGGSDGIGFAIDTATVQSVATDLITDGEVHHSWLGVAGTTTVSTDGQPTGALVQQVVEDSPAAAAGLRPGDHITGLDGEEIPSFPDLAARLVRLDPGTDVTLTVERNGSSQDLTVTLGEAT